MIHQDKHFYPKLSLNVLNIHVLFFNFSLLLSNVKYKSSLVSNLTYDAHRLYTISPDI